MPRIKIVLATITLLFTSLACRAATSLIFPDTPTPPPTRTPLPTLPPPTPTIVHDAACPVLLEEIIDASLEGGDSEEDDEQDYYVLYTIEDDQLASREDITDTSDLTTEQDSRSAHEVLWEYFASIIPYEQRTYLKEFAVASDGRGNILAAVAQTYNNPTEWTLEVDILDSSDYYSLTFTLLHEFAHLHTLNSKQVPPDRSVFNNPDDYDIYDRAVAACPQYFPGEGCSNPDSYINEFYERFWTYLFDEWQEIDAIEDEDEYYDSLDAFYEKHDDQFLTDYSATSPAEDIAETWAFFILAPRPEPDSIANEKVLFFYEYPELVQLRGQILNNICSVFPQ